jgi:hypothetical protein
MCHSLGHRFCCCVFEPLIMLLHSAAPCTINMCGINVQNGSIKNDIQSVTIVARESVKCSAT